jgi:hypothetical protein
VVIGSAVTTTDENGRFAIPRVAAEYDAVLVQESERYALLVRGATTRTLNLVGSGIGNPNEAVVNGAIAGGAGVPLPAGHVAYVSFLSTGSDEPKTRAVGNDGRYGQMPSWYGEQAVTGELVALALETDALNHPLSFDGFGSKPITLSSGRVFGGSDGSDPATLIELEAIDHRSLSGTLSAPDGYRTTLNVYVGPFPTDYLEIPPGDFATVLPVAAGELPQYVVLGATRDSGEHVKVYVRVDQSAAVLDVSAPAAPELLAPDDEAVDVDHRTTFAWTEVPDSVARVTFVLSDWVVEVVTVETSTNLPDLTAYGVPPLAGTDGRWRIQSTLAVDGVDAWTRAQVITYSTIAAHDRTGNAWSTDRVFTTAN